MQFEISPETHHIRGTWKNCVRLGVFVAIFAVLWYSIVLDFELWIGVT